MAHETAATVEAATSLTARPTAPTFSSRIPGTPQGLPAITEVIAAGVPVNVTLLFSADQYRAAADAYLAGVERRVAAGLDPAVVRSPPSLYRAGTSPWPRRCRRSWHTLGLAIGLDVYRAYRQLMGSDRFLVLANEGARMQRLLWASTGTKDPAASDTLYVHGLAAPFTVNTMPGDTLQDFYEHGEVGDPLPADGGDADTKLGRFADAGVDLAALAVQAPKRRRIVLRRRLERSDRPGPDAEVCAKLRPPRPSSPHGGRAVPDAAAAETAPRFCSARRATTRRSRAGPCVSSSMRTPNGGSG